jgi:integrase
VRGTRIDRGIYRRGKVFDVRFSVGPRTARHEISRTFRTLPEARLFREAWVRDRQFETAGLRAPETRRPRLTLGAILDAYLEESKALGSDPETIRAFAQLCKTIRRGIGDARRVPLAREDLVEFASWARAHTKTRGDLIRRAFIVIRTAHKRANLPRPDAPDVRFERGSRIRPAPAVALRFVDALTWGSPERTAAELVLYTAGRLEELLRLRVGDVDLAAGILRTETRKGPRGSRKATVLYPIAEGLRRVLEAAVPPGAPADRHVVLLRGHALKSASPLRKRLLAASTRAGIDPPITSLAWIRNFALSALVEAKIPVEVASRAAGHASVRTTEVHYVRAALWEGRLTASAALAALRAGTKPLDETETEGVN